MEDFLNKSETATIVAKSIWASEKFVTMITLFNLVEKQAIEFTLIMNTD